MTDPEIEYQRLTSGDAAAMRAAAETLESAIHQLDSARAEIAESCINAVWSGSAATAFSSRVVSLREGVTMTRAAVGRARGALETSASAYDTAVANADYYIWFWRNRPVLLPVIEELFARVVNAYLLSEGVAYNEQLGGVFAVLSGKDVDLDELDEDTREWVKKGLAKNEDWFGGNDSSLGPLIPNTLATDDDRGFVPQGLGYVPGTGSQAGTLVQGYYALGPDGEHSTYVALIDEATGRELRDAQLGNYVDPEGVTKPTNPPTHAGGVAIEGDNVYVTDNGAVFTYSLAALHQGTPGQAVPQSAPKQEILGGSYATVKDGKLYSGDFETNTLYVYEQNSQGVWVQDESATASTPDNCQGVVVRDGEYVFSSSHIRSNGSSLIVQNKDDETDRSDPYDLPNMSEGVVETHGDLLTTYESGAEEYDHMKGDPWGLGDSLLWANPFMTRTPLSDLRLAEDFEVEPSTLTHAANELGSPASTLMSVASILDGVTVQAHLFGEVPKAGPVSSAVSQLIESAADSVRTGAKAVALASDNLVAVAKDYAATDEFIGKVFTPR